MASHADDRRPICIASCVGGGPMSRLVDALRHRGSAAELICAFEPGRWRRLAAAGALGRLRARLQTAVAFPFACAWRLATRPCRHAVVTTNPFYLPLTQLLARPVHGRPVVALVYDLYPDAVEASGLGGPWQSLGAPMQAMNRLLFRHADAVVFIGEGMAEHAMRRYGRPRRWCIIETGADAGEFTPQRLGDLSMPETELEQWCQGRRIISYVGNLGHVHDWDTLATALRTFPPPPEGNAAPGRTGRGTSCVPQAPGAFPGAGLPGALPGAGGVVVAASGPGASYLRRVLEGVPTDRLRFEPPLDDRPWARLLAASDIALATLRPAAAHTSIPSKTFSAMAAGNAIVAVAPEASDLARLITRHRCGHVTPPGDPDALTRTLHRLTTDPAHLCRLQAAARRAIHDHYDLPRLADRWQQFLGTIPTR